MNWQAAALIFAAGIFYAGVKRRWRDLNGVRKIGDENDKRQRRRFNKLLQILRVTLPEEQREKIIELLAEDNE
jgi:hypothetical protein